MCRELTLYERACDCMNLWLRQQTNPTRLISVEPQWCHLLQPAYQAVIPTRNVSLPVLQEGKGFWHSGVQHLVCLELRSLTVAVYETVILKFFKAPGPLLTCYGSTNIRSFLYLDKFGNIRMLNVRWRERYSGHYTPGFICAAWGVLPPARNVNSSVKCISLLGEWRDIPRMVRRLPVLQHCIIYRSYSMNTRR
jgi:hypothetical protein